MHGGSWTFKCCWAVAENEVAVLERTTLCPTIALKSTSRTRVIKRVCVHARVRACVWRVGEWVDGDLSVGKVGGGECVLDDNCSIE